MKALLKKILRAVYNRLISDQMKVRLFRYIPSQRMFAHLQYLKEMGFEPGMVIDIGAYQGKWTRQVKLIFPHTPFVMIEPQQAKSGFLQAVTRAYPDVHYHAVLTGKEDHAQVAFHEMETGSSIYRENTGAQSTLKHYTMRTLDSLMREHPFKGTCLLKLDVQGAELDVLEGAREILQQTEFILLEASLLNYNAGAPLAAELIDWLNRNGFVLFDICDQQRRNENRLLVQADLLFSRREGALRKRVNFA